MRQAIVAMAIAWAGGCVNPPDTPAVPGDDPHFTPPRTVVPPGLDEDPPQPLRILPGDEVTLQAVSAETTEYEGLLVDELGILHVPLAGDVEVGGLTLSEAEARVQAALRRYDTVVVVNLFITELAGHRATVLGAVNEPGRHEIRPGTRLADLLGLAGGLVTETAGNEQHLLADLDGARLVRGEEVVPASLRLALRGVVRHNVRVRPGDHLYVPPNVGTRISVLGEVHTPSVVPYRPGLRLTEALAMAGGITIDGDRDDVRVIRGGLREPRVYTTSTVDLVNGRAHNVELAPGDIVFVTEHWIASVGEVLNRLSPLLATGTTIGVASAVAR